MGGKKKGNVGKKVQKDFNQQGNSSGQDTKNDAVDAKKHEQGTITTTTGGQEEGHITVCQYDLSENKGSKVSFGEVYHVAAAIWYKGNAYFPSKKAKDKINNDRGNKQASYFLTQVLVNISKKQNKKLVYNPVTNTNDPISLTGCTYLLCEEARSDPSIFLTNHKTFFNVPQNLTKNFQSLIQHYLDIYFKKNKIKYLLRVRNKRDARDMNKDLLNQIILILNDGNAANGAQIVLVGDEMQCDNNYINKAFKFKEWIREVTKKSENCKDYMPYILNDYFLEIALSIYLHNLNPEVVQIGMQSGGLDGPAFMGMKTIMLTMADMSNLDRMQEVVNALPNVKRIFYTNLSKGAIDIHANAVPNKQKIKGYGQEINQLSNIVDVLKKNIEDLQGIEQEAGPPAATGGKKK